ncbi:palmitoyl-acyl carrier protein thioesterase, chloroplastic-like [Telopea speciosissima]|uniref:palmitoyl-acyl carrier protein thioesterase, chloroplastic-like n=1 Tax=Telopea speciosissima TaxID=54955 RepID=UPI001CC5111A|nr:palmitoyl-acyl carrier protein thioesterase, chloroplastic-like [Telopea speciosissima]
MSATATSFTSLFLNNSSSPPTSLVRKFKTLGTYGIKSILKASSTSLPPVVKVYARAGTPHNISGHEVDLKSPPLPDMMKFLNQLPGSGSVFSAIPNADEKKWKLLVRNLVDAFSMGEIVNGGPVFRQNYCIRSYDLGPNQSASLQTLMNLIQFEGEILARSTSISMMMNKQTRKLSKFPQEFGRETESFVLNCDPLLDGNSMKLPKFDDNNMEYVQTGLIPIWNDLDVNQHVSHVKYSGWMVQTVPDSILKTHELAAITMEFRRECGLDSVLESLTSVVDDASNAAEVKSIHLLRLENGAVVAKGWTKWRLKDANNTLAFGETLSP